MHAVMRVGPGVPCLIGMLPTVPYTPWRLLRVASTQTSYMTADCYLRTVFNRHAVGYPLPPMCLRQGGIMFHEGRPCGADLRYEGVVHSARRGRADSFSKLLFQRMAREGSPSIGLPALLHAIEDGGNGAGEGQVEGSGPQDVAMG